MKMLSKSVHISVTKFSGQTFFHSSIHNTNYGLEWIDWDTFFNYIY